MSEKLDLTACDREPIHIPGAIQPHGMMLIADPESLQVRQAAGDVEGRLGAESWLGASLGVILGDELAERIGRTANSGAVGGFMGRLQTAGGESLDVTAHRSGGWLIVELEPGPRDSGPASEMLAVLESAGASFARASGLQDLCDRAAREFRNITGFDRVMIYRFLDDDAGTVLAEDKADDLPSFLNHHFPGSDIPRQARALYVRNLVRVIADVHYEPQPLRPALAGPPLDMSDCALRSVSPIHLQYMRNMGVGASASISIVENDRLWGLVACHHRSPRFLPYQARAACRTLAGGLSRQVKARQDAEAFRERVRLRSLEDEIRTALAKEDQLDLAMGAHLNRLRLLVGADGFALVGPNELLTSGACPPKPALKALARWVRPKTGAEAYATNRLSNELPAAEAYRDLASGLLAVTLPAEKPLVLMWLRAERLQVVEWAGNPHKAMEPNAQGQLTPRSSFEAWSDSVRGEAQDWTPAEVEAAVRIRAHVLDLRRQRRLGELNRQLGELVAEKDAALGQKEVLLREMNHRVQNSLQLVSSFLGLQVRATKDATFNAAVEEAQRRLGAVSLVHRRLYRADQIETIDMSRYLEELWEELTRSIGPEWRKTTRLNLSPVVLSTDKAVTVGLIATELLINANKYAYGGVAGPLELAFEASRGQALLIVADRGVGKHGLGSGGFGTRMMSAMVAQLSGTLEYQDNDPGARAVLSFPV